MKDNVCYGNILARLKLVDVLAVHTLLRCMDVLVLAVHTLLRCIA